MRTYLFEKANYFLKANQIKVLSETDHSIRLKVGRYEVVYKYQNHKLIFLCTCKTNIFNRICSHSIAASAYLLKCQKEKYLKKESQQYFRN